MHRCTCTMDFYKKVKIFKVRGPGSHSKPLAILINLGMCIAIWTSCIIVIAYCWHKNWFGGSRQTYIDVQRISIRK